MEDALQGILLAGLMVLFTNGIAYKLGFFRLPSFPPPPIAFSHLLSVFGIYLGFSFILPTFLQIVLIKLFSYPSSSPQLMVAMQFLIALGLLITLILYMRTEGKAVFKIALKNPNSPSSPLYDFGLGLLVWFVGFPWVVVASQFFDFLLYTFFQFEGHEQVAVRYLKENLTSPSQVALALISIVVIAPIVEEILFRATLQQYLKKFFSLRTSIIVTSAIFACFHFSPVQHLSNLSLIPSLFVFACFLGYTYERQGSVFASIGLHLGFNLASSVQILFFQGT